MQPLEDTIVWRLKQVEDQVKALDIEKAEAKDLAALTEEVRSLRRSLITFSLSMVGSGLAFLLGVLALQHGG